MSWDFVGRAGELRSLEAGWLRAGAGEAAPVTVVYGESGIGKTRTVAELARVVRARGAEVWWGTCYEAGTRILTGCGRKGSAGMWSVRAARHWQPRWVVRCGGWRRCWGTSRCRALSG
jgi:hypothetical protein